MILRSRPSGFKLFLLWRGSILPRIALPLLINVLVAIIVTMAHGSFGGLKIPIGTAPFALLGLPLAIFLGFRNSAAYDRFWEARKLWGEVVLRSRALARQCQSLIVGDAPVDAATQGLDDLRVRMTLRCAAFAHSLRHLLRHSDGQADTKPYLREAEWQAMAGFTNKPNFLLMRMGDDLREAIRDGRVDPVLAVNIDHTLNALGSAAASCERIVGTPIPFSYTLLLHRTAYLYCYLLPFGLVDTVGFMTPVVVLLIAYTFFGLDALGDEIEEPFGLEANDLPRHRDRPAGVGRRARTGAAAGGRVHAALRPGTMPWPAGLPASTPPTAGRPQLSAASWKRTFTGFDGALICSFIHFSANS